MKSLTVVFRADASLDIGTGHVMRCLTLADALRERGAICRFICRTHPGNLLDLIRQRGHEAHALPLTGDPVAVGPGRGERLPAHAAWLGTDWATDAQQTLVALGAVPSDWLIVDHYALDTRWERSLRTAGHRLMVIDDLADRPHDCDLLLDQNLGRAAADYAARVPAGCTVLAGPKYALLRPEFAALRPYSLARRAEPEFKHLLITLGGVDKDDATGKVLDALRACTLPADCRITVVMGPHAPWLEKVRDRAAKMPWPTEVQVNVGDMAKLMADSDLAIGAAGSTSWERCTVGLPTLMFILADNQREAGRAIAATRAAQLIESGGLPNVTLQQNIHFLNADTSSLRTMSDCAIAICDGQGTALLCERLFG